MDVISEKSSSQRTVGFDHVRNVPIESVDFSRVLPRQISTGSTRGTQTVGYGNTKIDGSNNRIVISEPDSGLTINVGVVPTDGGTPAFGMSVVDIDGFTLFKLDGQTWFWYDKDTEKNTLQVGKLPDGTYGIAAANEGFDVEDGY